MVAVLVATELTADIYDLGWMSLTTSAAQRAAQLALPFLLLHGLLRGSAPQWSLTWPMKMPASTAWLTRPWRLSSVTAPCSMNR